MFLVHFTSTNLFTYAQCVTLENLANLHLAVSGVECCLENCIHFHGTTITGMRNAMLEAIYITVSYLHELRKHLLANMVI